MVTIEAVVKCEESGCAARVPVRVSIDLEKGSAPLEIRNPPKGWTPSHCPVHAGEAAARAVATAEAAASETYAAAEAAAADRFVAATLESAGIKPEAAAEPSEAELERLTAPVPAAE